MITKLICIALGSGLGGVGRYLLGKAIHPVFFPSFPWGTLVVNLLGCLVIGSIYGAIDRGFSLSENMRLFLTVGFCGGFTTFSTFSHENFLLFQSPQPLTLLTYMGVSLAGGLFLVYAGYLFSNLLFRTA
ncbi:MAG: fluoride efflux transporter CrcB [Paramuribaculum sp.]|nr:fluoride efflux transporter CrcB [Paramuribaculum sp.]